MKGEDSIFWLEVEWWREILNRGDKDRDDLFAETPPLEGKRLLFSRAATRKKGGSGLY